jgi:HK97 gp10 family phage protein
LSKPISQLRVEFEKLPQEVSLANLRKAARIAGELIAENMAGRAPRDKGRLADDIMTVIERGATIDQVVAKIGPSKKTAWRANFIEFGVRPHVITARTSRVLVDRDTGDVFGVGAKHPGHSAEPFIRPAIDETGEAAADLFAEELDKMILRAFQK